MTGWYVEVRLYTDATNYVLCPNYRSIQFDVKRNDLGAFTLIYPKAESITLGLGDQKMIGVVCGFDTGTVTEVERYIIEGTTDDVVLDGQTYKTFEGRSTLAYMEDAVVYPQNWPTTAPSGHEFANATFGTIMRTLIQHAKARGCFPDVDETSFSGTTDSNGTSWPSQHSQVFANGTTYLSILQDFMQKGFVDGRMDGWNLRLYVGGSYGSHIGIGTVEVRPAHNASDMNVTTASAEACSAVLVDGEEGTSIERTSSEALTLIGRRRERAATQGGVADAGVLAIVGDAELEMYGRFNQEESVGVNENQLAPFLNFNVGDWIYVRYDTAAVPVERRVYQIAVEVNEAGNKTIGLTLNSIIYENDIRLQRKIEAYTGQGSNYGSTPVPQVEPALDQTTPKTPTGLVVEVTPYGPHEAAFVANWNLVTLNDDETSCNDLSHYEVHWKYHDESQWSFSLPSTDTNLAYSPVSSGRSIDVQVRAVDTSGHTSAWSASYEAQVTEVPPPTSPAPTVTGGVKSLFVQWEPSNSLSSFNVEVHISTTSDFTATKGNSETLAGTVDGVAYTINQMPDGSSLQQGVDYYIKTIAFNSAGVSDSSAQAEGALRLVEQGDISASTVLTGQLMADSIVGGSLNVDVTVVGSLIATGAAGETVSLSGAGFQVRGGDAFDNPTFVDFPTDGSKPNIISGTFECDTIEVTGNTLGTGAVLHGESMVSASSTLKLANRQGNPVASPTVYTEWPQLATYTMPTISGVTSLSAVWPGGAYIDVADGHIYYAAKETNNNNMWLCKSRLDGGTSTNLAVKINTALTNTALPDYIPFGVVKVGSYIYVVCRKYTTTLSELDDMVFRKYAASNLAYQTQVTMQTDFFARMNKNSAYMYQSKGFHACTATDGTDLFVGYCDTGEHFRVRRYNTSGVYQSVYTSTYDLDPSSSQPYTQALLVGNFDFGSRRFILNNGLQMAVFTESGGALTYQSTESFPVAIISSKGIDDPNVSTGKGSGSYCWDGTRFIALPTVNSAFTQFKPNYHSRTKWTSESSNWWIGQTYNSPVYGYYSLLSPLTSFTMSKRAYLRLTVGNIDNQVKVFLGRNATEPSYANMYLNYTMTSQSARIDLAVFSGTTAPYVSTWPAATPGVIVSEYLSPADGSAAVSIAGDGEVRFDTVLCRGITDASTVGGNKPALRVGDPSAAHLRVDGDEIISMANDTTQGSLGIQGKFFKKWDFGITTQSTNSSGYINVNHNMGVKAAYATLSQASYFSRHFGAVWDPAGSTTTYNRFCVLDENGTGLNGVNFTFIWFCIAT